MRNRVYSLVAFILLLTCNSFAFAQSPQISTGLTWLYSTQTTTGNWPEAATTDYYSTAAALDAIYSVDPLSPAYGTAFQWLSSQIVSPTDYLSRQIIALKRAGQDTSDYVASLLLYRNIDGGFGGGDGYPSNDILDTALALLALKAANYSDTTLIGQSLSYLTNNQNADGGWGFYPSTGSGQVLSDPSNAYITATVLRGLAGYSSQFSVQ